MTAAAPAPGRPRLSRVLHSKVTWALTATGSVVLAAGLVAFEPWALWVDKTVVEAAPAAAPATGLSPVDTAVTSPVVTEPVTEYTGTFISHEHATSGEVRIIRLADGSHVLRLENLDTSNGPDLKVVLSDAAVKPGRAGWHVFDDNAHVKLGELKGNRGSQNYAIPADVAPADFRSVSIWCDRFNVSFGATELARTAA